MMIKNKNLQLREYALKCRELHRMLMCCTIVSDMYVNQIEDVLSDVRLAYEAHKNVLQTVFSVLPVELCTLALDYYVMGTSISVLSERRNRTSRTIKRQLAKAIADAAAQMDVSLV